VKRIVIDPESQITLIAHFAHRDEAVIWAKRVGALRPAPLVQVGGHDTVEVSVTIFPHGTLGELVVLLESIYRLVRIDDVQTEETPSKV
jgi:hypothetical protein